MHASIRSSLAAMSRGDALSRSLTFTVVDQILRGEVPDTAVGALLMGWSQRGETWQEISGAAQALREHATAVRPRTSGLLDVSSTGHSGRALLDVPFAVAIVAAACGQPVAQHLCEAERRQPDIREQLGIGIAHEARAIAKSIDETGVGFLCMTRFQPALRRLDAPRSTLGVPTLFDLLGPLTNPARPPRCCVGVYDPTRCDALARSLGDLGATRAVVLHGFLDDRCQGPGIDQVSLCGPTRVAHWHNGALECFELHPRDAGVDEHALTAWAGGDGQEHARALRDLVAGAHNAYRDAVIYSGALALWVASDDDRHALGHHADRVRQALDSGRAAKTLRTLIRFGHADSSS